MSDDASTVEGRSLQEEHKAAISAALAALKANVRGFVTRRQQNFMIGVASRTLGKTGAVAAIEAKTGTGKSLAYLSAGFPLALATGRRLVISTETIALQEQLYDRDIPAFMKATGLNLKVALGKGRGRYVCPRNLSGLTSGQTSQGELDLDAEPGWPRPPRREDLERVQEMSAGLASGEWNGDMDRRPALPPELMRLVTLAPGSCAGAKCGFAAKCPVLAARKELKNAAVVVLNHDLLLSELALSLETDGQQLLDPSKTMFVVDEAHQLGEKAIEHGTFEANFRSAERLLDGVRRRLLGALRLAEVGTLEGLAPSDMSNLIESANDALVSFEARLQMELTAQPVPAAGGRSQQNDQDAVWRGALGKVPTAWRAASREAASILKRLLNGVRKAKAAVKDCGADQQVITRALTKLSIDEGKLQAALSLFYGWAREDDENKPPSARWISRDSQGGLALHCAPVKANGLLEAILWSQAESVLLTSATLSSGGSFDSFAEGLGLPEQAETICLDSPFDLREQAVLNVPWIGATPQDHEGHCAAVSSWLTKELAWAGDEGALVLFTSKRKMSRCLELMPASNRELVLVQGTMAKGDLLRQHSERVNAGKASVIFGTNSFGEGVDLAGKLLTEVVITQLPFMVPTEPVMATLAEWYEENGRNPFAEISIPDAIRVLTQYCGRLIRTNADSGRITVLDRRLIEKSYGKRILDAMPPFTKTIGKKGIIERSL